MFRGCNCGFTIHLNESQSIDEEQRFELAAEVGLLPRLRRKPAIRCQCESRIGVGIGPTRATPRQYKERHNSTGGKIV